MKNQYFADKRDFFKFDFLLALMECPAGFRRFTFVPLLTSDDGSSDGNLTDYASSEHPRRQDLWNFLRDCLKQGQRDLRKLREYMKGQRFEYVPYKDNALFTHARRDKYFSDIPDKALKGAIVFFDPDNGFEVPSMTASSGDKYIRYVELAGVIARMDSASAAVVYQHFPRKNRDIFLAEVGETIRTKVGVHDLIAVSDNVIAFFVIPKTPSLSRVLKPALAAYAMEHGLKMSDCI